ncbi:hypothetical protein BDY19DRAFT_888424 [Irpex rosettiformis]|uniref:Uncharacterized protein n=1 Tax=Irpex rosettiformis TaxID=378272 RepID=A0ACB8U6H4_9APHY|nr:hypothetical protein BDY19DRAFT_888424 [Irpex rosettiformis]
MFSILTTTAASQALAATGVLLSTAAILYSQHVRRNRRGIPKDKERVVVIGGGSGIGRAIAHIYSTRGAKVCIVGRQGDALESVKDECVELRAKVAKLGEADAVITVVADFADAEDMVKLREVLVKVWNGVDTVIVSAGVSALRPLLEVAGVHNKGDEARVDDVQKTIDVSNAAVRGNYTGPLVTAVTLIPLLQSSSSSPSILLISSLAALVPAPTRSLYGSTKSASLLLYQSLAIEHPQITFTAAIPATVEGNFRASAVDQGPVRETDPNRHGLKREYVARRCVEAVDAQHKTVLLPYWYARLGHLLYWVVPSVTEYFARRKYNF